MIAVLLGCSSALVCGAGTVERDGACVAEVGPLGLVPTGHDTGTPLEDTGVLEHTGAVPSEHTGWSSPTGDTAVPEPEPVCGEDAYPAMDAFGFEDAEVDRGDCATLGTVTPVDQRGGLVCGVSCDREWARPSILTWGRQGCDGSTGEVLLVDRGFDAALTVRLDHDAPTGEVATCTMVGSGGPWTVRLTRRW